jgi:hypothetical protein
LAFFCLAASYPRKRFEKMKGKKFLNSAELGTNVYVGGKS